MGTWFDKFYVQILRSLSCGGLRQLHLLLDYKLFLFFKFVDEVISKLKNDSDERSSYRLIH